MVKPNPLDERTLFNLVNDLSKTYFGKTFKHHVQFNHRLRTTGGRYIPTKKCIELNPKYVVEMGADEFVGIIKHELCHYHLHIEGKGYQHRDKDFRELLVATNSPRFCKPLPSEKKKQKYKYCCVQCHHIYKRARRVNINKYLCGQCKGKLKLIVN